MRSRRALFEMVKNEFHLMGPGDAKLELPQGPQTFQMEQGPPGLILLPIVEYEAHKRYEESHPSLPNT